MVIPSHLKEKMSAVLGLYEKLDGNIEKFQTASALRCAKNCGRCCENPKIFISVLEVLPLADQLWQSGHAETMLAKIHDNPQQDVCVFYQPDPLIAGNGRCSIYPWRPLLCRLFGYAAKNNKYDQPEIVTCPTMKSLCATEYDQATQRLREGSLVAPMMQEYAIQLLNIDHSLGKEQLPINQAVKMALEKVGLLFLK